MEYSKFKVFGERNSGTKYLKQLISLNSQLEQITYEPNRLSLLLLKSIKYDFVIDKLLWLDRKRSLGWKHGLIDHSLVSRYPECLVFCIVKNPYSFLLSLYQKPYHFKGNLPSSFNEFITQPWILRSRDGLKQKVLSTPVDLWNYKNQDYLNYTSKQKHAHLIRYEDLLKDSKVELAKVWNKFEIEPSTQHSEVVSSTVNSVNKHADYKNYYLHEKWKQKLDYQSIQLINHRLDKELVSKLGYEVL